MLLQSINKQLHNNFDKAQGYLQNLTANDKSHVEKYAILLDIIDSSLTPVRILEFVQDYVILIPVLSTSDSNGRMIIDGQNKNICVSDSKHTITYPADSLTEIIVDGHTFYKFKSRPRTSYDIDDDGFSIGRTERNYVHLFSDCSTRKYQDNMIYEYEANLLIWSAAAREQLKYLLEVRQAHDYVVNHMDNDSRNNELSNLELITDYLNKKHAKAVRFIAENLPEHVEKHEILYFRNGLKSKDKITLKTKITAADAAKVYGLVDQAVAEFAKLLGSNK